MTRCIYLTIGQIVIPIEVSGDMQVEHGSRVEFVKTTESWRLKPAIKPVTIFKGMIAKPKQSVSVEDINRAIANHYRKLK